MLDDIMYRWELEIEEIKKKEKENYFKKKIYLPQTRWNEIFQRVLLELIEKEKCWLSE